MVSDLQEATFAAGVAHGINRLSSVLGSTLANPEQWLVDVLSGGNSRAGVRIDYQAALTIAYVWDAQQMIAGDTAGLPLETKRREADDDLIPDRTVPAWFLLNGDASDTMSSYLFREIMTHWALLLGNGMAYIYRDSMGRPVRLIPALPGTLRPARVVDDSGRPVLNFIEDGRGPEVYYNHRLDRTFDARDILHIRGLGDDLGGHPLTRYAKNSFGLMLGVEKHGSDYFKRGGTPKIVLRTKRQLDEADANELAERFEQRHSEANRPAVASGDLEIEKLPADNDSAQWDEARTRAIVEVAAWYGIPATRLGAENRGGYNSLLFDNQAYVLSLRKWLKRWETEIARKLLSERDYRQGRIVVKHNPAELLETDIATKTDYITQQHAAMLLTTNEARQALGHPKVEGGDIFINPNTTSTKSPDETPESEQDDNETAAAAASRDPFVTMIATQLDLMARTMTDSASRKLKKGPLPDDWSTQWAGKTNHYIGPAIGATSEVFTTLSMDEINAVVTDWSATAAAGEVLVPSPQELADQIVGEPCTS